MHRSGPTWSPGGWLWAHETICAEEQPGIAAPLCLLPGAGRKWILQCVTNPQNVPLCSNMTHFLWRTNNFPHSHRSSSMNRLVPPSQNSLPAAWGIPASPTSCATDGRCLGIEETPALNAPKLPREPLSTNKRHKGGTKIPVSLLPFWYSSSQAETQHLPPFLLRAQLSPHTALLNAISFPAAVSVQVGLSGLKSFILSDLLFSAPHPSCGNTTHRATSSGCLRLIVSDFGSLQQRSE